jgi:hypothetical protein
MNALGLKCYIQDMTNVGVPVVVTFGAYEHQVINAVEKDGKLVLVALAEESKH